MKRVNRYIADDGTMFTGIEECRSYEDCALRVKEAMSVIHDRPNDDGCKFSNGHGFVQHAQADVAAARSAVLEVAASVMKSDLATEWIADTKTGVRHRSHVGRLFDDFGNRAITRAWNRLSCIDEMNREWGQPYYVTHPEEAEMICLNTGANS